MAEKKLIAKSKLEIMKKNKKMRYKQNCEKKVQIANYKLRIIIKVRIAKYKLRIQRIKVTICEEKKSESCKNYFYSMAEKKIKLRKVNSKL